MTDVTPPTPPVAPPTVSYVAPITPPKRAIWPWLVGGGALLFVLLVGAGAAVIVYGIAHTASEKAAVSSTVMAFDAAYKNSDCELFEKVTTSDVRDKYTDDDYSCDDWKAIADSLTVEGDYTVDVVIKSSVVTGAHATVHTTESFDDGNGGRESSEYTYKLEHSHGGWVITSYEQD